MWNQQNSRRILKDLKMFFNWLYWGDSGHTDDDRAGISGNGGDSGFSVVHNVYYIRPPTHPTCSCSEWTSTWVHQLQYNVTLIKTRMVVDRKWTSWRTRIYRCKMTQGRRWAEDARLSLSNVLAAIHKINRFTVPPHCGFLLSLPSVLRPLIKAVWKETRRSSTTNTAQGTLTGVSSDFCFPV